MILNRTLDIKIVEQNIIDLGKEIENTVENMNHTVAENESMTHFMKYFTNEE